MVHRDHTAHVVDGWVRTGTVDSGMWLGWYQYPMFKKLTDSMTRAVPTVPVDCTVVHMVHNGDDGVVSYRVTSNDDHLTSFHTDDSDGM